MKALFFFIVTVIAASCTIKPSTSVQAIKQQNSQPAKAPSSPSSVEGVSKTDTVPAIEGTYKAIVTEGDESEPCQLTIVIRKKDGKYHYTLTLPGKVRKGGVTISKSDDLKQFTCMLTFEGIQWASYEGDISNEDEKHPAKELELPVGITMGFMNNELTFQNYGNAMNSYTVIQECGQKFVYLAKQK
jgi:hypothetical protein